MIKDRAHFKAMLAAVSVYTIWGFTFLASRKAQDVTTPFVLLAYRFDLAFLLLSLPLVFGKAKLRLRGKKLLPVLLLGLCEPCIYFIGEQYGMRFSNTSFSGIMIAVIPIAALILSAVFLKEKPTATQFAFSLLSIAGIIVITLSQGSGGGIRFVGFLWLLLAVLSGSSYGVISRRISDEFTVYERTFVMQLMGAVFFTVLALAENHADLRLLILPLGNTGFILAVLYLALGASVLGYLLFNYAVSHAPMANVICLCNLTTVLSVLAGVILLHEPFSLVSGVAVVVVLVGICGVQLSGNNADMQ